MKNFFLLLFLLTAVSGLVLAGFYRPTPEEAFTSLQGLKNGGGLPAFLRGLHKTGATFLFLFSYLYLARGLFTASWRRTGPGAWLLGLLFFLLMMGLGFTGTLLPMGQMSYWSGTAIFSLIAAVPFLGARVAEALWIGEAPRLGLVFVLHLGLAILFGIFLFRRRRAGLVACPAPKPAATLFFLFLVLAISFVLPSLLDMPENNLPADPFMTPEHVKAEWFFLPFYGLLRSITASWLLPVQLLDLFAMGGLVAALALLPWLDRGREPRGFCVFWTLCWLGLGGLGALPPEAFSAWPGQGIALVYFLSFPFFALWQGFRRRK